MVLWIVKSKSAHFDEPSLLLLSVSLLTLLLVSELVPGSVPRKRHPQPCALCSLQFSPVAMHALAFVLGLLSLVGHHSGVLAWWNVGIS